MSKNPDRTAADPGLATILSRVAGGDAAAFEELYRRTSAKLYGVCLRILSNERAAEDALQECFLSVWRRSVSFDQRRGTPMTWLITIARNQAVNHLRAARPFAEAPIEHATHLLDQSDSAIEGLLAEEEQVRLNRCLSELNSREMALIRAAHFEGSTYSEIASRSGTPLGTIKTRIRGALAQLRNCLR